jgi:hypothetical protein
LLICVLLLALVHWSFAPNARRLNLVALFAGLSLTHHRTALFFAAPALIWAAVATARHMPLRRLGWTAACALAPLLLYLWLPFRSARHPALNWGNTAGSLGFFWDHVGGRLYYPLAFGDTAAHALTQTRLLFDGLWRQFHPEGIALAAVGLAGMVWARRQRFLGVPLIVSFILVLVWAAFYKVDDRYAFYVPAVVVVSIWCGAGMGHVLGRVRTLQVSAGVRSLLAAAGVAVVFIIPLRMIVTGWQLVDRSREYEVLENAAMTMSGIPRDAVVLLLGDQENASALYYFHVLHPRQAPLLLSSNRCRQLWCMPLLPREILGAVIETRLGDDTPEGLAYAVRQRLDPRRALYLSYPPKRTPPGFIALRDYRMWRLVEPPGVPQAPDEPGLRPLLRLGEGGLLLRVVMPREVRRGEPFAVTAAIRWDTSAPKGELHVVFAHASVADKVGIGGADAAPAELRVVREIPLLFGAQLAPNAAGRHYKQTTNAIISRVCAPGSYHVFAQYVNGKGKTALAPAGMIEVK